MITKLDIEEIGPTPSPADREAYVVRIGGREPEWARLEDSMERAGRLREKRQPHVRDRQQPYTHWGAAGHFAR